MSNTVAVKLAEAFEAVIENFEVPAHVILRVCMLIDDVDDIKCVDGLIVPEDDVRRGNAVIFTGSLVIRLKWEDPVRDRPNLEVVRIETWPRHRLEQISFVTTTKDNINIAIDWKDGPEEGWPWSGQALLQYGSPDWVVKFPIRVGHKDPTRRDLAQFFRTLLKDLRD